MTRIFSCLILILWITFAVAGQGTQKAEQAQDARDAQNKKMLDDAAAKGTKLPILGTVRVVSAPAPS
jgi:hypothetical protein